MLYFLYTHVVEMKQLVTTIIFLFLHPHSYMTSVPSDWYTTGIRQTHVCCQIRKNVLNGLRSLSDQI